MTIETILIAIFGVAKLGQLLGFLIHRPDWNLPAGTVFNFRVDRITATYISAPPPQMNSLKPVYETP